MPLSHMKRATWLRDIIAADRNPDRPAAEAQALRATEDYFRKKKVAATDTDKWDQTLEDLSTFAEQVAPGKMALVYAVLRPPASSRFHQMQQRRQAFSEAMKEGNFEAAADNLAHLQASAWDRLGFTSAEAAADYRALFAAITKRKACRGIQDLVEASALLDHHITAVDQRPADHGSRLELPVLRRWLNAWLHEARRQALQEGSALTAQLTHVLMGSMRPQNADGSTADGPRLTALAKALLRSEVEVPAGESKAIILSGIALELLRQDNWDQILELYALLAAMPADRVPATLKYLRCWKPNRDNIAMYSELLAHNVEASEEHPATRQKLRFMRYLEGPAQYFWLEATATGAIVDEGRSEETSENLLAHIKASVTNERHSLILLKFLDVDSLFHGEDQRDRIGVFFGNLRDAYVTALQQAVKRGDEMDSDAPVAELLVKLRPYCGDGQVTQLHEWLMSINQAELRVPIMEEHFNLDERLGEHLRNFWNIQRERYARAKGGFDPDHLTEPDVMRIEGDPEYQQHYNNKSTFAAYMRTNWPDFVKDLELGDQPPSFFDRLLRRGGASRAARNAEFDRRLDHQVEVFSTLEPDPQ